MDVVTRIGPDPEDRVPDAPCFAHEEPNPWCPVCRGTRSTMAVLRDRRIHRELTGIERTHLESVRERITDDDRPAPRAYSLTELLDNIERWVRGEAGD